MERVKSTLDRVLGAFCVVLFAVLVLVVAWQVFTRQVLDNPSGWSEESAKYVFVWLSLFGAALVFGERGHIVVDVAVKKAPEGAQRVIGLLMQVAILAFAGLVLVYGGLMLATNTWSIAVAGLPATVGPLYLALPVSGVLIVFYTVYHLVAIAGRAESAIDDAEPDVI